MSMEVFSEKKTMTKEDFLGAFLAALMWLWYFMVNLERTLESLKKGRILLKRLYEGVKELMTEVCAFKNVAWVFLGSATVTEMPMEETVGLESMLGEVWKCINERPNSRIIGLYGLGGIGKTTLLKEINNELGRRNLGFKHVIWVSVSEEPDFENIQGNILRQLQIPDGAWQHLDKRSKAVKIYNNLKKKFVLLLDLDETRKGLNLVELGVPNHDKDMQKGSKVVFTARTLEICCQMEAQEKIKVCLPKKAAEDLLWTKAGNKGRPIIEFAETMAAECQGLSLALITAGLAMASRDTPEQWDYAISMLRNYPSEFTGMNGVLYRLMFNLNGLKDDRDKRCFRNCCYKFLEDHAINPVRKEELIDLWEQELTDRNHGEFIIGSLKKACLLEDIGESGEYVKMHPLIRGMGLELERSHAQG